MHRPILFALLLSQLFMIQNLFGQNMTNKNFHELSIEGIDGKKINMKDYKGKYVLVVNVASECGYTPQYKQLQELSEHFKDKLIVIGFPCNQFGGQEPGNNKEIISFCEKNYHVSFPLTTKIEVKGDNIDPIYQWLASQKIKGEAPVPVKWNFTKYLIDPSGKLIASFKSSVEPASDELTSLLK